ncbi:hypothetical protein BH10PSE7_BH10PSE7_10200 [soil metagenome]
MPLTIGSPLLTPFQASLNLSHIYRKDPANLSGGPRKGRIHRVLTWNIERGLNHKRIAETVNEIGPDIACLQEVDWGNSRTGGRDILQDLAENTGMLGFYGIEFLEIDSPLRNARFAGGGAIGNAFLTRIEPRDIFRIELPIGLDWANAGGDAAVPFAVRWRMRGEPRIGRRFALGMEMDVAGRQAVVACTHLEDKHGGVSSRWAQFEAIARAVEARRNEGSTAVIAGDMNTFDSRLARLITRDRQSSALGKPVDVNEATWWSQNLLPATGFADPFPADAWTFRVPLFLRAKLDWLAIAGAPVTGKGAGAVGASDHRPIWADISIADP